MATPKKDICYPNPPRDQYISQSSWIQKLNYKPNGDYKPYKLSRAGTILIQGGCVIGAAAAAYTSYKITNHFDVPWYAQIPIVGLLAAFGAEVGGVGMVSLGLCFQPPRENKENKRSLEAIVEAPKENPASPLQNQQANPENPPQIGLEIIAQSQASQKP